MAALSSTNCMNKIETDEKRNKKDTDSPTMMMTIQEIKGKEPEPEPKKIEQLIEELISRHVECHRTENSFMANNSEVITSKFSARPIFTLNEENWFCRKCMKSISVSFDCCESCNWMKYRPSYEPAGYGQGVRFKYLIALLKEQGQEQKQEQKQEEHVTITTPTPVSVQAPSSGTSTPTKTTTTTTVQPTSTSLAKSELESTITNRFVRLTHNGPDGDSSYEQYLIVPGYKIEHLRAFIATENKFVLNSFALYNKSNLTCELDNDMVINAEEYVWEYKIPTKIVYLPHGTTGHLYLNQNVTIATLVQELRKEFKIRNDYEIKGAFGNNVMLPFLDTDRSKAFAKCPDLSNAELFIKYFKKEENEKEEQVEQKQQKLRMVFLQNIYHEGDYKDTLSGTELYILASDKFKIPKEVSIVMKYGGEIIPNTKETKVFEIMETINKLLNDNNRSNNSNNSKIVCEPSSEYLFLKTSFYSKKNGGLLHFKIDPTTTTINNVIDLIAHKIKVDKSLIDLHLSGNYSPLYKYDKISSYYNNNNNDCNNNTDHDYFYYNVRPEIDKESEELKLQIVIDCGNDNYKHFSSFSFDSSSSVKEAIRVLARHLKIDDEAHLHLMEDERHISINGYARSHSLTSVIEWESLSCKKQMKPLVFKVSKNCVVARNKDGGFFSVLLDGLVTVADIIKTIKRNSYGHDIKWYKLFVDGKELTNLDMSYKEAGINSNTILTFSTPNLFPISVNNGFGHDNIQKMYEIPTRNSKAKLLYDLIQENEQCLLSEISLDSGYNIKYDDQENLDIMHSYYLRITKDVLVQVSFENKMENSSQYHEYKLTYGTNRGNTWADYYRYCARVMNIDQNSMIFMVNGRWISHNDTNLVDDSFPKSTLVPVRRVIKCLINRSGYFITLRGGNGTELCNKTGVRTIFVPFESDHNYIIDYATKSEKDRYNGYKTMVKCDGVRFEGKLIAGGNYEYIVYKNILVTGELKFQFAYNYHESVLQFRKRLATHLKYEFDKLQLMNKDLEIPDSRNIRDYDNVRYQMRIDIVSDDVNTL
jgi:hypothetical protein